MNRERRNALLLFSGLAAAYAAFRIAPGFGREELVLQDIEDPAGFRRLTAGQSSSGFDPFVGLEPQKNNDDLEAAKVRVRQNICAALYYDRPTTAGEVPVASFSDYYCPFCRVQTKRLAEMEARQEGEIRVSWHELPLLGETSTLAAKAALAARNQGAYPAFHERLMRSPFRATPEYLQALANDIGVDHARLVADMNSEEVLEDLENSAALARIFAFVGTPAMVIGRTVVQGEVSERTVQAIIKREREEGWGSVCRVA
ncbi:DsbA family protein [uncultured Maritimibacter sp.]|uniref:DsbA family protein n=1 Tax=uncultured Maritimibacter sp. TaxID=991866 RepID=UPI0026366BD6|nr:DsbA family protein [uncultured Maritimibacter sp.]